MVVCLREESWRVFENRVLRKIFATNKDEVSVHIMIFHSDILLDLYLLLLGVMMREKRNSCRVFVWKALTKHPLGIPRNR
jgi:hypothetical protein